MRNEQALWEEKNMFVNPNPDKLPVISTLRQERRVFAADRHAVQSLAKLLAALLGELDPQGYRQPVLLAIGTDRSTGDSLGPLVGTRINELAPGMFPVYGTLDQPVHAVNLKEKIQMIKESFPYPLIIAVDACLGQLKNIGSINMGKGHLQPGTGVHKTLPPVGEIFFSGVVNIGGYLEYLVLQNTRLCQVMKMADCIAQAIITGYMMDKNNREMTGSKTLSLDKVQSE
jgi:putative sporulation protein YyaC